MSNITTRTDVTSGTYTIPSGATYTVNGDYAFYVNGSDVVLQTADGATGIIFDSCGGSDVYGGAMDVSKADAITLANCIFQNNTAVDEGAILLAQISTATFSNCSFKNNKAIGMGGTSKGWNGALGVGNGSFTFTGVTFSGNTARLDGGALGCGTELGPYCTATATDVSFDGNTAGQYGGAIYVSFTSTLSVTDGTMSNNYAKSRGGAVAVDSRGTAIFTNVDITGNSAKELAGGLGSIGTLNISSMTVSGNSAETGGGIANAGTFTATSVTISGNSATVGGGLVNAEIEYLKKKYQGIGTVTNCLFQNNTATMTSDTTGLGGGLFNQYVFTVNGSTFSGNTATQFGGAVANYGVLGATNTLFNGNHAGLGGALYNAGTANLTGTEFRTSSDSIANDGTLNFCGTNTLKSQLSGGGLSYSGADNVVLKGTGTVSQTYVAQGNTTTFEDLKLDDAEILGGNLDNDVTKAELYFKDITMTSNAKIYGAGTAETKDITVAGDVALDFTGTLNSYNGQILAGGKAAGSKTITVGTVSLTVNVEGKVGIIYAGAELTDHAKFSATAMNTTIDNGTFYSYVGNGSRETITTGQVDTVVGTCSLTINGGTFKNIVYAGAFTNGGSVVVGGTNLTITNGTFEQMVFGGNGAKSLDVSANTTVQGSVSVLVDATEPTDEDATKSIHFERSLVGGSVGTGVITGNVTVTFTGKGKNLTFGSTAYIGGDSQKAEKYALTEKTFVGGKRKLVFNEFDGIFGGNIRNGFDEVSFAASSVTFEGQQEVDLRYIKTWNFDVSDSLTDLTWTDGENDFADDTINLLGWDETDQIFMTGSDATLKGFDPNRVVVDGFTSGYEVKREGNSLMICAVVA